MDAHIMLRVDGTQHSLAIDTRTTLLDALRDRPGVMSPKKGCDHGQCGACTVLLDGRIINPRLARSQFIGGMTMGLSMALHEESVMDARFGHFVNHDFAGDHIAVNADVEDLDAVCLSEEDANTNPMGARHRRDRHRERGRGHRQRRLARHRHPCPRTPADAG